jgi:rhodanese-related sulfurtransferase
MDEISVAGLSEILPNVTVVDVRELNEYVAGHVPNAIHIPLATIPLRYEELTRDENLYLICEAGARSAQAGMFLEEQGFKTTNVVGGTGAWRNSNYELAFGE